MAIQYVGGRGAGRAGSTSSTNVAINSGLSGGIGSAAAAGDLVIVTVAVATQGRNPTCSISGYTALTQQHTTATTYDISVCTSYKFMGSTPDTTVTIPSTGNTADGQGYEIHVFRGVDPTVPLDGVTPTYATGSGTNNRPDPASITPATTGAWIYFGGGGAASTGTTVFTASYLSGFLSHNGADTNDGTAGAGYYSGWTSGAYNGAVWTGGSVNAANSWGCTTLVLRPLAAASITGAGKIGGVTAFGAPVIKAVINPAGFGMLTALGAPVVRASISSAGFGMLTAFGLPIITPVGTEWPITGAGGIAMLTAFGGPTIRAGIIGAGGLAGVTAFGQPTLRAAIQGAGGLVSLTAFGQPSIGAHIIGAGGLAGLTAFGLPVVAPYVEAHEIVGAGGLAMLTAFGLPVITPGLTEATFYVDGWALIVLIGPGTRTIYAAVPTGTPQLGQIIVFLERSEVASSIAVGDGSKVLLKWSGESGKGIHPVTFVVPVLLTKGQPIQVAVEGNLIARVAIHTGVAGGIW